MDVLYTVRDAAVAHPQGLVLVAILALLALRFGPRLLDRLRRKENTLIDEADAARFEIGLRDGDPEIDQTDEIASDLGQLIAAGRWDLFHSLLAAWEDDRATTPFGTMFHRLGIERALWPFAEIEAAAEETGLRPDDAQIDALVGAFEARAAADPGDHIAATLAARAHVAAGRITRGDGYIEEMSAQDRRRMAVHYETAERLLAAHADKRSSLVAEARYLVCLGIETGSTLIRTRFAEWVAVDPDDVAPYQEHGRHLLPRWFGDLAELEAEARNAAQATQPRRGAAGYAIFHGGVLASDDSHDTLSIMDPELFVRSALDRARTAGSQWGVNRMAEFLMLAMLKSQGAARETYRAGLLELVHDHLRVLVPRAWAIRIEDAQRELARLFREDLESGARVRIGARGVEVLPAEPETALAA